MHHERQFHAKNFENLDKIHKLPYKSRIYKNMNSSIAIKEISKPSHRKVSWQHIANMKENLSDNRKTGNTSHFILWCQQKTDIKTQQEYYTKKVNISHRNRFKNPKQLLAN